MILVTFCLQLIAMYLAAISKDKHFKHVFKRFPGQFEVISIRVIAILFCLIAWYFLVSRGWAVGIVYGLSQMAIAITLTSLLLREKPRLKSKA